MANSNTDLHIRIKSKLGTTQQVLLYQEAVTLNVKNFKTAAWEHQYIAPGAQMRVLLPTEITIGSMENISQDGRIMTKLIPAEYNTAWEIYSNDNALDVRKSNAPAPTEDTIEIHNENSRTMMMRGQLHMPLSLLTIAQKNYSKTMVLGAVYLLTIQCPSFCK